MNNIIITILVSISIGAVNCPQDINATEVSTIEQKDVVKFEYEDVKLNSRGGTIDEEVWELSYKPLDIEKAQEYFEKRNVMWANIEHLRIIDETSKKYNVDPLFMMAITGAEQSLVKRNTPKYYTIINNPFNVHGSWEDYNYSLRDSSEVACGTISKDRWKTISEIAKEYAEASEKWEKHTKQYYKSFMEDLR